MVNNAPSTSTSSVTVSGEMPPSSSALSRVQRQVTERNGRGVCGAITDAQRRASASTQSQSGRRSGVGPNQNSTGSSRNRLPAQPEMLYYLPILNLGSSIEHRAADVRGAVVTLTAQDTEVDVRRKFIDSVSVPLKLRYQQRGSRLQLYDHEVCQLLDGFVMAKMVKHKFSCCSTGLPGQLVQAAQEGRLPYLELVNLCGMKPNGAAMNVHMFPKEQPCDCFSSSSQLLSSNEVVAYSRQVQPVLHLRHRPIHSIDDMESAFLRGERLVRREITPIPVLSAKGESVLSQRTENKKSELNGCA
ncbi:hypothetical protein BJ742DRAFT_348180 [Cladochytrium replicatum]|nr:hypothetical protein BJ742DRAFT_348180 [Cladochytrium replicatum]